MEKGMSIFMMVLFGLSGAGIAAAAWLIPSLQLAKAEASIAGLIGIGFMVIQGWRLRHSGHDDAVQVPVEIPAEDKY